MKLIFDIETNGFLSDVTKIHCIVIKDIETNKIYSFKFDEIDKAIKILSGSNLLVGHNILSFDLAVIKKLYPNFNYDGEVLDTLLVTRLIWTNIKEEDYKIKNLPLQFSGRHSLEAWGYRLGLRKGDFIKTGDFSKWSEEMQKYCELDVEVTHELYKLIVKQNYSQEAIKLEHEFAKCIIQQEAHGFYFDVASAKKLYASLASRRLELEKKLALAFPNWSKSIGIFVPKRDNKSKGYIKGKPVEKFEEVIFNPNSRDHIADRLIQKGWKPQEFTPDGKPKVDETVLDTLPYTEAKLLSEHFLIQKRIAQLAEGDNAWLKLEKNGKLHGQVIINGTITGRCTHQRPNIAQVPSVSVPYGKECRSLFYAPTGYVLIGSDASGLELRCLAHYLARYDSGDFGKNLLEGDIHTSNQRAIGLSNRDLAKRVIYGVVYGIGDKKLGAIVGGTNKDGKEIKVKLFKNIPALKFLRDDIISTVNNQKFLFGLDKRKLHIRSEHSSLNTLIQSAGGLLMKQATVILHNKFKEKKYDKEIVSMVAHIHDELQLQCLSSYADEVGKLAIASIKEAGEYFKLRCPLDAQYKIGQNWAQTH